MKRIPFQLPPVLFTIGFILVAVFLFSEAKASSRKVSLDELIELSELVISGTVVGKSMTREPILVDIESLGADRKPTKEAETINQVLTEYEIELTAVLRGCYKKSVIPVTVPGGEVGNKVISYSHSTIYLTEGKKYYFFLGYEQRNDKYWVVASHRGVFEEAWAKGGIVIRNINRNPVIEADGGFVSETRSSDKGGLKFEQFLSRVMETCQE